MKHIAAIINQNLPAMEFLAWFLLVIILLAIGIVAVARFVFRAGRKGVDRLNEKRRKE